MKTLPVIAAIFTMLCASTALADPARHRTLTAAAAPEGTGVNGEAVLTIATTDSIDCGKPWGSSEVALHMAVTAGTTTAVTVSCEESPDNTNWFWLPFCTGVATSTCAIQTLTFPVNVYTNWSIVPRPRAQYLRCHFTGTGTGTVVVTGTLYAE
jgi:hypothetical protein